MGKQRSGGMGRKEWKRPRTPSHREVGGRAGTGEVKGRGRKGKGGVRAGRKGEKGRGGGGGDRMGGK